MHRIVEEAGRPAPISARLLNAGVPGEIYLILDQDSQFRDRRSVPPVVLKLVSIAPGSGTQRSIEEYYNY
jgi:hypothetical protein